MKLWLALFGVSASIVVAFGADYDYSQSKGKGGSYGQTTRGWTSTTVPCYTTMEYNPVCGTDGVTYSNPGQLRCAIQNKPDLREDYKGRCGSKTTSRTTSYRTTERWPTTSRTTSRWPTTSGRLTTDRYQTRTTARWPTTSRTTTTQWPWTTNKWPTTSRYTTTTFKPFWPDTTTKQPFRTTTRRGDSYQPTRSPPWSEPLPASGTGTGTGNDYSNSGSDSGSSFGRGYLNNDAEVADFSKGGSSYSKTGTAKGGYNRKYRHAGY